jgi:hypothetical protein
MYTLHDVMVYKMMTITYLCGDGWRQFLDEKKLKDGDEVLIDCSLIGDIVAVAYKHKDHMRDHSTYKFSCILPISYLLFWK